MSADPDYIPQMLRADMAEPRDAAGCPRCGYVISVRCWPTDEFLPPEQDPYLAAMLDGLADLGEAYGVPVFGCWMLMAGDPPSPAEAPWQVWRASDRRLIFTGDAEEATRVMLRHACAGRAEVN